MVRRVQRGERRHAREPVRTILVVLPPLVQDDVTLVGELGFRQRGQKVAHTVGLEPQGKLHRARRHYLPVVRAIRVGGPVEQRARRLQRLEVPRVVMLGALEHQVLEQVREAGAARVLVLRADVVPDVDRHDRTRVVLVHEHRQAVREDASFAAYFHPRGLSSS